jgi:hypothetical protein
MPPEAPPAGFASLYNKFMGGNPVAPSPPPKMETTTLPSHTSYGFEMSYVPSYCLTTLDWFNIARCARERMTEYSTDIIRWRGERRSFYSSLQNMDIDTKIVLD